jgi:hypothetical protein
VRVDARQQTVHGGVRGRRRVRHGLELQERRLDLDLDDLRSRLRSLIRFDKRAAIART